MARARNRRGRRPASLAGTNLSQWPRGEGNYYWRRVHELTGERLRKTTDTNNYRVALKKAQEFEEEYQAELRGEKQRNNWKLALKPLTEEWIRSGKWTDVRRRTYNSQILRALRLLNLRVLAHLNDLGGLNTRFLALEKSEDNPSGFDAITLRECVQHPLRLFARWLAENKRYLGQDPLSCWSTIDTSGHKPRVSDAHGPDEVARAFAAQRCLDALDDGHRLYGEHPLYPAFVTLLMTAPRSEKLCQLDVDDLVARGPGGRSAHLCYGEPVGKKEAPAGGLDPETLSLLMEYRGNRTNGPLFLSRTGRRMNSAGLLKAWRRAFSMGLVDALWPPDTARDLDDVLRVHSLLFTGKPHRGKGGPPTRLRLETKRLTVDARLRAEDVAGRIRPAWQDRMGEKMRRVQVRSLRKTLQTWAVMKSVPEVLIDLQIGHKAPARDAAIAAAEQLIVSRTGRKYYFDPKLLIVDPARVAVAARELLQVAEDALADEADAGTTVLLAPSLRKAGRKQAGA